MRLTIRQHLDALQGMPEADWVLPYNAVHGVPRWLGKLDFDAVVLHTTFLCMRWSLWFEPWRKRSAWLAELDALKIALPQDEYHHAETLDDWLDELGVGVVGTVLDSSHRDELYPRLSKRAAFYDLLTGYIDDAAAERLKPRLRPNEERELDVVYRARNLPYWLGSHGQLKHRIGEAVAERGPAHELRCDISTRQQQTILGDAWMDFMASGRLTIGAESGASALDRRGELPKLEAELRAEDPELTFEGFAQRMPPGWDDYRFFAVSPRHLEAVVTKTAQILVEGHYSGVLEAERHYIPVRRDLSNLDDALEAARDEQRLAQIAEQAYHDVYESGRFSSRQLTGTLETMLSDHVSPRERRATPLRGVVERVAGAESHVERTVLAPLAGVLRVGRDGYGEMLAGLRLVATDPGARRLLFDYARSTETRNHVSPRQALSDLLALGVLRRTKAGKFNGAPPFEVSAEVDTERQRLVIRSHASAPLGEEGLSPARLADLLEERGWEFLWDHSDVGTPVAYPVVRSHSVELPQGRGPTALPVLNWLARYRPRDVAAALALFLPRR
ncbi:MAG: hypothetical protein M3R70_13710 [Actinomycetota bacterium]|nr:hypothetical protein [Actinomycetota bacterium]